MLRIGNFIVHADEIPVISNVLNQSLKSTYDYLGEEFFYIHLLLGMLNGHAH